MRRLVLGVLLGGCAWAVAAQVTITPDAARADPCATPSKRYFPVDIDTATTTQIVNSPANEFFYLCAIHLVTAAANNVTLVEDNNTNCASPTAGLAGGVTAAEGWNFGANGGLALGNGASTIAQSTAKNRNICLITSATTQLSGTGVYVTNSETR